MILSFVSTAPRLGAHSERTPSVRLQDSVLGDLQNGTVYRSDLFQCRKLNISNLRIDLRSGIRQFGERHMVKILAPV